MKTYKVTVDRFGTICWRNEAGQLHRENGPAIEYAGGHKRYYLNNKLHREDGPAIEREYGDNRYYLNGREYYYADWLKCTSEVKEELTIEKITELLASGYKLQLVKD